MDKRFLQHYSRELTYLRQMAGEFAKEFPKIAGRLSLKADDVCPDPYVERLLEGFAFLAARVHLKLDAEFPRFTQSLMETVCPHYLAPTPSMVMVQFKPALGEAVLAQGFSIPREAQLRSEKVDQTACIFRTAHEVTLWPLEIIEAQYHTRDLPAFDLPQARGARAGIRIRLQTPGDLAFSDVQLDSLTVHIRGADETPMHLYEQIFACTTAVVAAPAGGTGKPVAASTVRQVGFDDDQKLLPYGPRSFQGYRLLHEYFAFPQRFMFFELSGLRPAFQQCKGNRLDVFILLREPNLRLDNQVSAGNFALFCTPAINLFHKTADRIRISDKFSEFHVVPDRTRPLDYEVYQVEEVIGYGSEAGEEQEFRPFYSASDFDAAGGAYYAVNRQRRVASEREKRLGRRSSYTGSEVFISLVDAKNAPYRPDLQQFGVKALCTNRDLPVQMPVGIGRTDFTMDQGGPWESIRCVGHQTVPQESYAQDDFAWRVISHMSLNYLSLADTENGTAAAALQSLLRLYADATDPGTRKQVEGVKAVHSSPVFRRITTAGGITFARGLEVAVTLDPAAFEGTGVFLLGAVLERFFARYVSINSFTETVIQVLEKGKVVEVMRWPARTGQRQIF